MIEHTTYSQFELGTIANPNYTWLNKHLNEERAMNNEQKARIIGGSYHDLTIQFEDGTIVEHKKYNQFELGTVVNPKCTKRTWLDKHLNEERTMNNGLMAKIIGGTKSEDLTIQFEDGMIVHHKKHDRVCRGMVGHPTLVIRGKSIIKGSTLGTFCITKLAFNNADKQEVYYECQCKECGLNRILTPQEMLKHQCNKQR